MSQLSKIVVNGTYLQDQASGLGVVNQNLISALLNFNQQLDFTLYSHSKYYQNHYPNQTIAVTPSLSPDRGFSGHLKRFWWYQTNLNWQLKKQQANLFFSPVPEGILFPNVAQVIMVHDLIPLKYPELNPKWQYYYRYILPIILNKSQKIIAISQHTKQDLINNYKLNPETIEVVYLGCDRNLFYPQPNLQILQKYQINKYFLYVGDMRFYKNLSRCLMAFDNLPFNDYQFVITGKKDNFFYPEIQRQTEKLAAKDRIIFLDYVPTEELPSLYSQAQALVFASLYEGFGLPILEAMACGCPVITSNVTSIPEVGGESVLYVDPYNIEDITQAMYLLITNSALRNNLIHQGQERVKSFNWSTTADRIKQILFNN
ncbi:group 1 glycosyl transferase [Chondrocystis sp. NIES-4102]|nr:group 1 glycosyl transferase [Chondrocystis sp. NIES-4102]